MREDRLATACLAIARRLRGQPSRHRNESPLLLHIARAPHPLGSGFAHGPRDPMRFSPPPCPPPSTGKRLAARWRPSGSLNFTGARLSDWRSATGRTARRVLFLANGGNSVTGSCLPAWRRAFAAAIHCGPQRALPRSSAVTSMPPAAAQRRGPGADLQLARVAQGFGESHAAV